MCAVRDLKALSKTLSCIYDIGRKLTTKVSDAGYLRRAFDMVQLASGEDNYPCPNARVSVAMQKVKDFAKANEKLGCSSKSVLKSIKNLPPLPTKKKRRSERLPKTTVVTPPKAKIDGSPPLGFRKWTRNELICRLVELEGTDLTRTFISNVIKKGTSDFKHNGSIYKMFWKWKSSGDKPVGHRGICVIHAGWVCGRIQ